MDRCAKCGWWWNARAVNEYGEADPHCVGCGYRPARPPTAEEADHGERPKNWQRAEQAAARR